MKKVAILVAAAIGSVATIAVSAPDAGGHHHGARFERLKAADTNADGSISRTEAAALPRLAEHFDRIDANADGQVSFEELAAAKGRHAGGKHGKGFKHRMARADTDGDGKVSRDEVLARAAARFDRLDANKDGFLTEDEAPRRHGRMGPR